MKLFKPKQQSSPRRRQFEQRQPVTETEDSSVFRRGRTLTGSASSLVRTSNEGQADLKSSRVQMHELKQKRRRLFALLAIVSGLVVGLYLLMSQFTAYPITQASPDPSMRLDETYSKAIGKYLNDHLGERWRFMTNMGRLTEYVQTIAPEVEMITLNGSPGFGKSLFTITFREPIASWNIGNNELYVDGDGVPFQRSYFGSPSLRIDDQSGMTTTLSGQSVVSNRFMSYIGQVIGTAKTKGYTVQTIVIPAGMTRQVQVYIKDIPYPIKFSSDRPAREGVDDMAQAIQWMQSHQLTPEYIDVRVKNKVFYR